MEILASEFERNYILINEHGKFHPTYMCDDYVALYGNDGEIIDYNYINLTILKTAEESYQEWLLNKDKPQEPNKMEVLEQRVVELGHENKLLKAQNEASASNQEFLESCLMEMAGVVYA